MRIEDSGTVGNADSTSSSNEGDTVICSDGDSSSDDEEITAPFLMPKFQRGIHHVPRDDQLQAQPVDKIPFHYNYDWVPSRTSKPRAKFEGPFVGLNEHCRELSVGQSKTKEWYRLRVGVVSSTGASKMIRAAKALSYQPSDNLGVELQWVVDELSLASVMIEDAQAESKAEGFLNTLRERRDSDPGFFSKACRWSGRNDAVPHIQSE